MPTFRTTGTTSMALGVLERWEKLQKIFHNLWLYLRLLQSPSTSSVALGLLTMQVLEVSQDQENLWLLFASSPLFLSPSSIQLVYLDILFSTCLFLVVFNAMLAQSEGTHQVIEFSELKFAQNQRRSDQSDKLSTSNLFNPQNSIFKNMKTPKNWKNGSCSETLKVYFGIYFFWHVSYELLMYVS